MRFSDAAVVSTAICLFSFALTSHVYAESISNDPCPGQGHRSTGSAQDRGLPIGAKVCPEDGGQKILFGGCDYNPYEILEREFKGGGPSRCGPAGTQITPQGNNTAGIDPALACRLTKLFQAAKAKGCSVKIISAYRSEAQQQCMCGGGGSGCAPAGHSCHQKGLAVDVSAGNCAGWMRKVAPEFRLVYPYYGEHIQCAEHPRASVSSCNRPCDGGVAINPDLSRLPNPNQVPNDFFQPPPQFAPPTSGLSNQFRQALGMPQQPQGFLGNTGGTGSTPMPATPLPPQSQFCVPEYVCSGNDLVFKNSFCATQVQQTCLAGCSNGACINASSTNTNTNQSTSSSATDILDYLSGYTSTSTSIATATPLHLNSNLGQQKKLTDAIPSQPTTLMSTSSAFSPQALSPQTFVSLDLNPTGGAYPPTRYTQSGVFAILENMRSAVLSALKYLEPFRFSRARADDEQASYHSE